MAVDAEPTILGTELGEIGALLQQGRAKECGAKLNELMDACGGHITPDVLSLYTEYLLLRGRPFAAECALVLLVRASTNRKRTLLLRGCAAADGGDVARAQQLLNEAHQVPQPIGPSESSLIARLDQAAVAQGREKACQGFTAQLQALSFLKSDDVFSADTINISDQALSEAVRKGRPDAAGSSQLWGFYIGELCRRHFGATWMWRRRFADSTLRVPVATGEVEICPHLWALWRLRHRQHSLRLLLAALEKLGAGQGQTISESGGEVDFPKGPYRTEWGRDALTEALHYILCEPGPDADVVGLGLVADCPFSRVEVPLIVRGPSGLVLRLFWSTREEEQQFRRYLDMLSLSPMSRFRWTISTGDDLALPADLALYLRPDGPVRAALVARRLCTTSTTANARWLVAVAQILLNVTLDGSLDSLTLVDSIITDKLRAGGPIRWGKLFEDRFALLTMLTCYTGEVLRAAYGGEWGDDRITGERFGPTSGLELADMRFNLGAKVLRRFYRGDIEPLIPAVGEFGRRAATCGVDIGSTDSA